MAFVNKDFVHETTTTTGTGAITLAGAASPGRTFGSVMANGDVCIYAIRHQTANEWETGLGTWNTGGTLTRTTVLDSSNAGAAVNLSSGTKDVYMAHQAAKTPVLNNELAITMPGVSAIPAAASADFLKLYSRNRSGRMLPEMIGPAGVDTSLQPALFGNNVLLWTPTAATTSPLNFGINWTIAVTQAHPTLASTNYMTQMKRATFTTTNVSGNASGVRSFSATNWRGNAAGQGGFFFFARFGVTTFLSGMQILCGLTANSALLAGDPSSVNNTICIGKDQADTNWQVITRGTSATKTNTGVAVAAGGSSGVYDVMIFGAPNGSEIVVRMVDITSGTVVVDNQSITTNLPSNTTFLYPHVECRTTTGSVCAIFMNRIYVESDS